MPLAAGAALVAVLTVSVLAALLVGPSLYQGPEASAPSSSKQGAVAGSTAPSPQADPSSGTPTATAGDAAQSAAPEAGTEIPNPEEAKAGLERYLSIAPGNPAAGWAMLSPRRQLLEDRAGYFDFWSSIKSAKVSDCVVDGARVTCALSVDSGAPSQQVFWMVKVNGQVLVDVAGGSSEEQLTAQRRLEQLRAESLPIDTDGRWVAVLSAKYPGIKDELQVAENGTNVFYFSDIYAEHMALRERFPDDNVLALRRADFGQQGRDLWFTIADPGTFDSDEDVKQWCRESFPELGEEALENQCLPAELEAPHG